MTLKHSSHSAIITAHNFPTLRLLQEERNFIYYYSLVLFVLYLESMYLMAAERIYTVFYVHLLRGEGESARAFALEPVL
jgi:predicted nucleic-acid-binding protein